MLPLSLLPGELSPSSEEARIFLPASMALSTEAARMTPEEHGRGAEGGLECENSFGLDGAWA